MKLCERWTFEENRFVGKDELWRLVENCGREIRDCGRNQRTMEQTRNCGKKWELRARKGTVRYSRLCEELEN